jgi:UDP:flavonoid glycosyltransferase YjiC (YdhE family)
MADASPFSYLSSLSTHLNIYCEPPEFLEKGERKVFEPVAFYGSLPSLEGGQGGTQGSRRWFGVSSARMLKVYVSFGTVIWRYYAVTALSALNTLAAALGRMENVQAVISLGGTELTIEKLAALLRPNVSVESYVDQWEVLQEADVFFTHHGLNSTHEAIFHGVPMVSYPFFSGPTSISGEVPAVRLGDPAHGFCARSFQ